MSDEKSPFRVRSALDELQAYEPGRPIEEIQKSYGLDEPPVKLASNENPYSPPEELYETYKEEFTRLNRYPDGGCFYLGRALSEKYDWPAEGIVLGGGSDEVLDCLAKATLEPENEVVCADPSFLIYQMDALMMGASPVRVPLTDEFDIDLKRMLDAVTPRTRWVCLPNPNNPTSRYLDQGSLTDFYEQLPSHCLLLLDEAYAEFMSQPDYPEGPELLRDSSSGQAGLVVLRTFSKAFALPGLRVGYGLMEPELAREIHKVRPPFNVTRPGQAVAVEALEQTEFIRSSRQRILDERARLLEALRERGITCVEPTANFFLLEVPGDLAADGLFERLLPEGVIVRSMSAYGLENHVRVTVGKPEENNQFLDGLDKIYDF